MWFVGKKKTSFVVSSLPPTSHLELVEVDNDIDVYAVDALDALKEAYGARYKFLVGPFKTLRGARYMVSNNKPALSVAEAERLAKDAERAYLHSR